MKSKILIPILILAPLLLKAELTPYIVDTNGSTVFRSVPANKVFVVQHVTMPNDSSIALSVTGSLGGAPLHYYPLNESIGTNTEVTITLMKPLLLRASTVFRNTGDASDKVIWFGVLADQSDLYVSNAWSNTPTIENVEKTALALNLDVKMSSPRPTRLKVQDSTDLEEWEASPDSKVTQDGLSKLKVEVPLRPGSKKQFARVAATGPRQREQD